MTDLALDRGNDRELSIQATVSLEDIDLRFAVARRRGGAVLLTALGTGDDQGVAIIALSGAETLDLPAPAVLVWDLEGLDADDIRVTLARGRLLVRDVVAVTDTVGS